MTDNELKQAVGRVFLPQYKAMIPEHGEHEFSPEFEEKMRELIGGKKTAKAEQDTPARASLSHRTGLMTAAGFALIIGIGAAVFLMNRSDVLPDDTQPPSAAVQSGSQSSVSDKEAEKQHQLKYIKSIAAELADRPNDYYSSIYRNTNDETTYQKWENQSAQAVSSSAKQLGEYLKNADISYLGCFRESWQNGQSIVSENTVSTDIKKIFAESSDQTTVWIYPRSYSGSFARIYYTVRDGIGYICIGKDIFQPETIEETLYFSFTGSSLPMYSDGQLKLDSWGTDMTQRTKKVSRQEFASARYDQSVSVHNSDSTAGFTYSVDNSGIMPKVKISDIKLPKSETAQNAVVEIYLCKKRSSGQAMMNAAVMSCTLKEGEYDLSAYQSTIAKQNIDGIRIVMRFDTNKHPAPDEKTDKSGLKNAYTITAEYFIG